MTTEQRYVVKLASGEYVTWHGERVPRMEENAKMPRRDAYQLAVAHDATALRLKPSKRAAELAKLRAEVEALKVDLADASEVRDRKWAEAKHATSQLHAMTAERDHERRTANEAVAQLHDVTRERDALAAQLAALPPDVTDEELAKALFSADGMRRTNGEWEAWERCAARTARRLLRGPVAPARPVEELRDELRKAWDASQYQGLDFALNGVARRARELGAR